MSSTLIQSSNKIAVKKLTVATVCMNAKLDTKSNLAIFKSYIRKASEKGAKLVVFPEIALQQNLGCGRAEHQPSRSLVFHVKMPG
jgi:predicted amidohydrolase